MKTYIVTLKHDNGVYRIKTVAKCIGNAIHAVCMAENCPENAVTNIKVI